MTPQTATAYLTDRDLYADLVRVGIQFGGLPHPFVGEVWTGARHPSGALDSVLGLMANGHAEARQLRGALEITPPRVGQVLARAWWDSVSVRLNRKACTP
jgi:hypothetical protein